MEKETLIKFMNYLIAFAKVYRGIAQKVIDDKYDTDLAFHTVAGLIEEYLKDCQEATKPLLKSLKAEQKDEK